MVKIIKIIFCFVFPILLKQHISRIFSCVLLDAVYFSCKREKEIKKIRNFVLLLWKEPIWNKVLDYKENIFIEYLRRWIFFSYSKSINVIEFFFQIEIFK